MALQEIGPRFTLKLRSLRKGIPAVQRFGEDPKPLVFEVDNKEEEEGLLEEEPNAAAAPEPDNEEAEAGDQPPGPPKPVVPPKTDEYLWAWKVRISCPEFTISRLTRLCCSRSWKPREGRSFCSLRSCIAPTIHRLRFSAAEWDTCSQRKDCILRGTYRH